MNSRMRRNMLLVSYSLLMPNLRLCTSLVKSFERGFWKEQVQIRDLGNGNTKRYTDESVKYCNMGKKVYKY